MRPILLKIKGLNSFDEEQVIDFNKLTSKGLFGIFGPTGSGKTSIIDAITLSLYGEMSRYDGDSKNKKFININTDTCTVSFEFALSTTSGEERYIVERSYKRYNETQKVVYARFYKIINEGNEVLADKATKVNSYVEDIIGLSYKDFSKTVVLPQGKFSEFLLLANSERRNMLERIFRLEKYGENLLNVIRKEYNIKNQDLKIINTKLDMYGDINLNLIKEKEEKLNLLNIEYKELTLKQKEIAEKSLTLKNIQSLYNQLNKYEAELNKIIAKENEIKNSKDFLKKASHANLINPIYMEIKHNEEIKLKNERELKVHKNIYNSLVIKEKELYNKLVDINMLKDEKIPILTQKQHDLNQALSLIKEKESVVIERKGLLNQYYVINKDLEDTKKDIEELENKKSNLKDNINLLIERKKNIKLTLQYKRLVGEGVNTQNKLYEYEDNLKILINKKENIKSKTLESYEEMKSIDSKIASYELKIAKLDKHIKNRYKLLSIDIKNNKRDLEKLELKLILLQKAIEEAERKNLIFKLSETLEEGKPCVVCGSLVHEPAIQKPSTDNVVSLLEKEEQVKLELEKKKEILNEHTYNLLRLESLSKSIDIKIKGFNKNIPIDEIKDKVNTNDCDIENLLQKIVDKLNKLNTDKKVLTNSIYKDKDSLRDKEDEIISLKSKVLTIKKELEIIYTSLETKNIIDLSKTIKAHEEELIIIDEKEFNHNKEIESISLNIEILKNKYQTIKSRADEIIILGKEKASLIDKYESNILNLSEGRETESYLIEVNREMLKINKHAEELKKQYESVKEELNKESELKAGLEKEKETLQKLRLNQEQKLHHLLHKYNFQNIEEVLQYNISNEEFLEKEIDIQNFENSINDITSNIERIKKEIGNIDFVNIDTKVKEIIVQEDAINNMVLEYTQTIGILKDNINKMKADWINIEGLEKEKKELNNYIDILKDLNKLFEGKKFVEFVAKKQLAYIAADASVRLKDMSCGRYALELDDTDFVIRDDHYGGIRRSPKTLSGGETFMASLCLALALSSKIQLKNKSSLEFFFLDEGFGTLDLDSLDLVMESLIKLQSHKMKVGVISHVEEMKGRIPVKLVVKQANQGLHGTLVHLE